MSSAYRWRGRPRYIGAVTRPSAATKPRSGGGPMPSEPVSTPVPHRLRKITLYSLAIVCSLVAFNVHVGFTIYPARLVTMLFLASCLAMAAVRGGRLRAGPWDRRFLMLFAALLIIQMVSLLGASDVLAGLRKMTIYVFLMMLFLAVQLAASNSRGIMDSLWLFMAMGTFQGLFGLYQVLGYSLRWPMLLAWLSFIPAGNPKHRLAAIVGEDGVPRAFGTITEPNNYAGFMLLVLILALAWLLEWKRLRPQWRWLLMLSLLFTGIGMVLANSRSGVATLLGGCAILGAIAYWKRLVRGAHLLRAVLVVLLLIPTATVAVASIGVFQTRAGTSANVIQSFAYRASLLVTPDDPYSQQSVAGHLRSRLLALEMLSRSPALGVGVGNFGGYYSSDLRTGNTGSHSHHLDALAETGIIGAVAEWLVMGLVAATMVRGLRAAPRHSPESTWLVGLLSGFLAVVAGNLLYHYYLNEFVWFLMAAGVALSQRLLREECAWRLRA